MTNYKKIKKMSKRKMADFLLRRDTSCDICVYAEVDCGGKKCEKGVRKWLESEVEE